MSLDAAKILLPASDLMAKTSEGHPKTPSWTARDFAARPKSVAVGSAWSEWILALERAEAAALENEELAAQAGPGKPARSVSRI